MTCMNAVKRGLIIVRCGAPFSNINGPSAGQSIDQLAGRNIGAGHPNRSQHTCRYRSIVTSTAEASEELPRAVLPALHPEVHNRSLLGLMLNVFAGRELEVLSTMAGRRQFNNMVRLMDKTVIEYTLAAARCEDWVQGLDVTGAQISSYFRAIDHMKSCIGALHRTFLHLDRIKRLSVAPTVDRIGYKVLQAAAITEINRARDWIEHTDARLLPAEDGAALPDGSRRTGACSSTSLACPPVARLRSWASLAVPGRSRERPSAAPPMDGKPSTGRRNRWTSGDRREAWTAGDQRHDRQPPGRILSFSELLLRLSTHCVKRPGTWPAPAAHTRS
jgi:hypothetical protein